MAEPRHILGPRLQVLQLHDNGSDKRGHQILAYTHLHKMYGIIMGSGMFLSTPDFKKAFEHCQQFLVHYKWLHVEAAGSGMYHMVPKFHYLLHVMWFGQWLSPRATWCYPFEDVVGLLKLSAAACSAGTPTYNIPRKIMQNCMFGLSIRLKDKSHSRR